MANPLTPGPGRPPGAANKLTKALKDMILGALDEAGGQSYLTEQAKKNPKAFLSLLARVLPTQLEGSVDVRYVALIPQVAKTTDEWKEQYRPALIEPPQDTTAGTVQ